MGVIAKSDNFPSNIPLLQLSDRTLINLLNMFNVGANMAQARVFLLIYKHSVERQRGGKGSETRRDAERFDEAARQERHSEFMSLIWQKA